MSQHPSLRTIAVGEAQVTLIQDGELDLPAAELVPDVL